MYKNGKIKKSIKTRVVFRVTAVIAIILVFSFGFILYHTLSSLSEKADSNLKIKTNYLANTLEQRFEYLQEST
ncbi:MAG: hypothetical protein PF437_07905 [Sulfurimonas sp.]|jgi:succinate dehydrogenase hydrophobic anchor subunit|nr:hypothetical protein [Sulfurimonas sp.]